ncbi:MAG: carbohydrate ABC transporter permease [Phycisphaerae bacterium]|jgi:ABC-type glycerol-3-phosphate transport system permease component
MKQINYTAEIVKNIFIIIILIFAFLGIYLMINVSLKDNAQFSRSPWLLEAPFHWENFIYAWQYIAPNIFNTVFVAFTTTIFSIVLAIIGAFFFARFKTFGSEFLFYVFIILMMYPGVANMVPEFKLISALGLYNTFWALIIPGVAGAQAMVIYIFRNFIEDIPHDLFDAAEVDGCSILGQIWNIVVPMSLPIIGTLGILRIIGEWNSFVGPLIFLRDSNRQLISVALLHLEGEYTKQWGQLMAGYTIASIPLIIIFIFCMKLFVQGLSEGAIKG